MDVRNWAEAKNHIFACVHKEKYGDAVCRPLLDLEEYMRVDLENETTAIVNAPLLEVWGVSAEEAFEAAEDNVDMNLMGLLERIGVKSDDDIFKCATTERQVYGAGVICNKKAMKTLHAIIGDFWVLPSSIHEVIVVAMKVAEELDAEDLRSIVKYVNATEVSYSDKLSDTVYKVTTAGLQIA